MKRSIAVQQHREAIRQIVERHHAKNPRVFGSVLHGQDTDGSDLDILIDYPAIPTMRIIEGQHRAIVTETARIFGPGATVRLFGSRTDDTARGGDIDLHIEAAGDVAELLDRELKLYARLIRCLGDRRIDIVVHPRGAAPRPIDRQAMRAGIVL